MLEKAKLGIAVSNASEKAKKAAKKNARKEKTVYRIPLINRGEST